MAECKVNIDGTEYYIPCDQINNLHMINGQLVNLGSSSITLKNNFALTGNTYPYITCSSNSVCRYYAQNNQTYTAVVSEPIFSGDHFYTWNYPQVITILLLILIGVRMVWKK